MKTNERMNKWDNKIKVFDKWGDLVYEKDNYNNSWDGTSINGDMIPDGTYFYIICLNSSIANGIINTLAGSLTIKR